METNHSPGSSKGICRVLVVGCGLGGLATAIALRRAGHLVTVFERTPELRPVGAGIQLSPNATRLFQEWGIETELLKLAYQPEGGSLRSYRGQVLSEQASGADIRAKYGAPYLVIHRADLLNVLLHAAQALGTEVKLGSSVESIDFSKPALKLSSGASYEGDLILGADGERSVCRDTMLEKPDSPFSTGDLVFRIAVRSCDVQHIKGIDMITQRPSVNVWMGPEAHAVSYILKRENILNVVLVCADRTGSEVLYGPQKAEIAELKEAFAGWDPIIQELFSIQNLQCAKWSLLQINEVKEWCHQSGRVALIGDAAHAMLPYLAQGAAQAFEDAGALGALFAEISDTSEIPDALAVFEKLRKPRTAEVRAQTNAQKSFYGLRDGKQQEERDKQLRSRDSTSVSPNILDDAAFQEWFWGYDVVREARHAWKAAWLGGTPCPPPPSG